MSNLPSLERLNCYDNQLETLDVTGAAELETLNCYDNQLKGLNVTGLSNLTIEVTISVEANSDTAGVTGDTGTKSLNVGENKFTITVTAEGGDKQEYHITLQRETAHHNSSGGGSSSSGGSSNITVTPPTSGKPNSSTEARIKVESKTDASGNTSVTVSDKNITDAIAKAEADAKKNGSTANGVTIVFSTTGGKNATNVMVNLPKTVQDTIISNKVVGTVIVVDNPDVQIGMDLKAVTEINKQAGADVSLTAVKVDNATLSNKAQAVIGNRPVFDFKVNYGGNKTVQSFGAGSVSVAIPYTIQKGEVTGNVQAVYVDESGSVTYLTNSSYDSGDKVLRFSTDHFSTYGVGYKALAPVFTDITNHWAKANIEFVTARGLLNGTSDTAFNPDGSMTRGMFVTALWRLAGTPQAGEGVTFTDVPLTAYYSEAVKWAAEKGIISGISATAFAPDQSITREQMAVIMQNYAKPMGYTLPSTRESITFSDNASISNWAAGAVKAIQQAGVMNGKGSQRFNPKDTATRAEAAAVLRRFVGIVIDPATAGGWTQNDSGAWLYYQNGKPVTGWKQIESR